MIQKDIIIIGSGINSLVSAAILKEAGKSILLLEARENIGGLASSIEFVPGFKCNAIYDTIKYIDPRLINEQDVRAKEHSNSEYNSPIAKLILSTFSSLNTGQLKPDFGAITVKKEDEKLTVPYKFFYAVTTGIIIGFLAGLTGTGGGIFLSPLISS